MPYKDPEKEKQSAKSRKKVYLNTEKGRSQNREYTKLYREANLERCRQTARESYHRHREKRRQECYVYALSVLGWSQEMYNRALFEQSGLCDICKALPAEGVKLCADHEHILPPKHRGLLCKQCNLVIGNAGDSIAVLESAIVYLRKHGKSQ